MSTSTALAIRSKVKPKPTKAEIIDALTQLKISQLSKARKEATEKCKELAAKIDARLVEVVRVGLGKLLPRVYYGYRRTDTSLHGVEVKFELRELPKEAQRLLAEYHDAKEIADRGWDESRIRKQIAAQASAGSRTERVDALLTDEESRKALEAMLAALG